MAMFTMSLFGGGLLLRYAEGATYLAVVNVRRGHMSHYLLGHSTLKPSMLITTIIDY